MIFQMVYTCVMCGTRFEEEGKDEDDRTLDEILVECAKTCCSAIHRCNEDNRGLARLIGVKKDNTQIIIVPEGMDSLM